MEITREHKEEDKEEEAYPHSSSASTHTAPSNGPEYNAFASKLMAKMGWQEGRGLGREQQGIVNPVESIEKYDRGGLGFSTLETAFPKKQHVIDLDVFIPHHQDVYWLRRQSSTPLDVSKGLFRCPSERMQENNELYYDKFCSKELVYKLFETKSRLDGVSEREFFTARKQANPYESIGKHFFLNRAALKMANLDHLFQLTHTNAPEEVLLFADICAGPGGFTEYILWRKQHLARGWGFTLKGKFHKFCPEAKQLVMSNFTPCYGVDDDGNILKSKNIKNFADIIDRETNHVGVSLLTADGGVSVEGEENQQETKLRQLVLCQFLTALNILAQHGTFVCKIFDVFTPFTIGLICIMYYCFEEICICKPYTSRPANSERYLVCRNLLQRKPAVIKYLFEINDSLHSVVENNDIYKIIDDSLMDADFVQYLKQSNLNIIQAQIEALELLFKYIEDPTLLPLDQADIKRRCLTEWNVPLQAPSRKRFNDGFRKTEVPKKLRLGFEDDPLPMKTKLQQEEEARQRHANTVYNSKWKEPNSFTANQSTGFSSASSSTTHKTHHHTASSQHSQALKPPFSSSTVNRESTTLSTSDTSFTSPSSELPSSTASSQSTSSGVKRKGVVRRTTTTKDQQTPTLQLNSDAVQKAIAKHKVQNIHK